MTHVSRLDSPAAASLRSTRKGPGKRETSESCRQRAEADLLASAAMANANQRLRMQKSAQSWAWRAEMLQRVEDGLAQRASATGLSHVGSQPRP